MNIATSKRVDVRYFTTEVVIAKVATYLCTDGGSSRGLRSLKPARPLYPRLLYPMGTVFDAHIDKILFSIVLGDKIGLKKLKTPLFCPDKSIFS